MRKTKGTKPVEYYLNMNYPVLVYRAEEGGYVAEIEELPGCITEGETLKEIFERIENARHAWIEVAYEDGIEIPLPRTEREYSGKFVARIPKYLHQTLAEQAKREGVSLNQYVETLLSSGISTCEAKIEQLVEKIIAEKARQLIRLLPNIIQPTAPYLVYPAFVEFKVEKEQHEVQSREAMEIDDREMVVA